MIPIGEGEKPKAKNWNRQELKEFFDPVRAWQRTNKIASKQIYVAEFGVFRQAPGADKYIADLIDIFNDERWHWGFYSFREDAWPGMDYEIGTRNLSAAYWESVEKGEHPSRVPFYKSNPIFSAILKGIEKVGSR